MDWHLNDDQRKPTAGSSSPAVLLQFVGLIPADDLERMFEAIASDCDQIHYDDRILIDSPVAYLVLIGDRD